MTSETHREPDPDTIGGRVTIARRRLKLSMNDLGRAMGINVGYLSRLEANAFETVGSDKLAALSNALGVTMDWLAKGAPPPPQA